MKANLMKRNFSIAILSLVLPAVLAAAPSAIYVNPGVVTEPTNIDAVIFYNLGEFDVSGITSATNFALSATIGIRSALPFSTRDTAAFTNSGTMIGAPGYEFQTTTGTTIHSAESFYNAGSIIGLDTPAIPYFFYLSADGAQISIAPAYSQPLPSIVSVQATNIINQGSVTVGNAGKVQLTGQNVNLMNSFIRAGAVSETDPDDTTGDVDYYEGESTKTTTYIVEPPTVYDLFWGVTNGVTQDLAGVVEGLAIDNPPFPPVHLRGGLGGVLEGEIGLGLLNEFANMATYAYEYTGNSSTDIYYTVVFLNTNFTDTNITASVRFGDVFTESELDATAEDPYGIGVTVRFTEPVMDLSTGLTVSNSVYFLDSGLESTNNYSVAINAAYSSDYGRPDRFYISTALPLEEWEFGVPANATFDPTLLYTQNEFLNEKVTMSTAAYEAEIGRNPEVLNGLDTNATEVLLLSEEDFPDPTNEAGRIEINAQTLNLGTARLQAEGVVTLNASNLVGTPYGTDWGNVNSTLGSPTSSLLVVSNLFPTTFHRVRGEIEAWAASWINVQTNEFGGVTNNPNNVTNNIHYHIVWIDQDLRGTFTSTIRDLSLRSTNVVVQDTLRVIDHVTLSATNLTLNNTNIFTQNAGSIYATNLPGLQNLLVNSNAIMMVDNEFDVGYNLNAGNGTPATRKYLVSSVTNLGSISSAVALFDCASFENDGSILADAGGIIIAANTLGLGQVLTNAPNYLEASGDITLSANTILASNSVLISGGALILDMSAAGRLSDRVSGAPSTNQALVNQWQTSGGFSLLQKPAAGDLFGTEITTVATGFRVVNHIWAGIDYSNNVALGFSNNAVIGHLKLSRQSANALMEFSGAGAKNAMYVDYLELDANSYSYIDYRDGMTIDPNLTIYFADSNVDPFKLQDAYANRLVWVPAFSGPNSTMAVPYKDSSNVCLMNAGLAASQDISFFPGTPPNFFNLPYVLNNPTNSADTYPCPGLQESGGKSVLLVSQAAGGGAAAIAMISVSGDGTIAPLPKELTAGKTYTLTASPASGWVFNGWQTTGLTENKGGVNPAGLAGSAEASGNVLKFTPAASTTIVATFVPASVASPFSSRQGVYNGLFSNVSELTPGSSGFFRLTLSGSGSYSGLILMGTNSYSFSSKFPSTGSNQVVANPSGKSKLSGQAPLTLSLQLLQTNGTGAIVGDVAQTGWAASSQLWADLGQTWTGKNHSPWAGAYTVALPWNATTPVAGDSYATVTVLDSGILSAVGGLADGSTFNQTVPVSKEGFWPLFAVSTANDVILGWVSVTTNGPVSTNLLWSKGANNGLYSEGFTNAQVQLIGSPYKADDLPLTLAKPSVILSGGDLTTILTNSVTLEHRTSYVASDVTLRIQAATGSFSGWFTNNGKRESMSGVILQNTSSACGYFLGKDASGEVLLRSQ
jgi:hypothetical protein